MIILLHVSIALASLAHISYMLFSPSPGGLRIAQGLIFGTLGSGTLLVAVAQSNLLSACASGLFYLAVACGGLAIARARLVRQEVE